MSTRTLLGLLAAATAAASLLVGAWLFPLGSANRDESSYEAFASLLRQGHATLPLADRPYRPWASGVRMGRVVMKYTPPWPLALAAATSAVGEPRVASALAAAAAVLLVYALARELLADDRRALLAALLFAASPFLIIQSATTLAYVFQLALELAAATLLMRSCHTPVISPHPGGAPKIAPTIRAPANGRPAWSLAAAGALAGVAVFARPFDALLFVGPFAVLAFWPREHRRRAAWFVAGAAVPLGAFLAYNAATMGSPLSLPFRVTGSTDGFGFGDRGIFANGTVKFSLLNGIEGTAANLGWLVAWAAGGPVIVALAANGLRRHWRDLRPAMRALLVVTIVYPLAYLAFWGTYAVVHYWRGAATLGPFYHLPVLVPLVILAAAGWPKQRTRQVALAVVMVAVTLAWLPVKVADNQRVTAAYRRAQRAAATVEPPAVLLVADHGDRGYDSWTPFLANRPDLDQPVVYAEDRPTTNFAVADRYARDRHLARLVTSPTPATPDNFRVVPLAVTRGQTVTASIRWTRPVDFAYLVDHGHEQRRATDQSTTQWQLRADQLRQSAGTLAFGVQQGKRRWEVRVPYRVVDGDAEVIGPGRGYERRAGTWREADVANTITDRYGV
jgi:hypothetical protein